MVLSALGAGCGTKAAVVRHAADRNLEGPSDQNEAELPWQFAERVNGLFSGVSEQDLRRLVADPDSTIAVSGGWHRVLQTVAEGTLGESARPGNAALNRFLGLVEGRVGVPIPDFWEAGVLSTVHQRAERAEWDDYVYFPTPQRLENGAHERPSDAGDWSLRRADDRWLVTQGGVKWSLPAHDGRGPVDHVRVHLRGGNAYVALYAWPPGGHMVHSVDRSSGRVVWSSEVWADCGLTAYTGYGWHEVEIRTTSDQLVVFGLSTHIAYVEVFDRRTGQNLWRFNTYLGTGTSWLEGEVD